MKLIPPKPFFLSSGPRAVLLLHGFKGSTGHVKKLGRFLQAKGYTSYAPLYKGHGKPPEELLNTSPKDWWEDVLAGYQTLRSEGYHEIAVVGLSIGALFSLSLSTKLHVKGVVSMCAPLDIISQDVLLQSVVDYAKKYKKLEGKRDDCIRLEMDTFKTQAEDTIESVLSFINYTKEELSYVNAPTLIVQGRLDQQINANSANLLYDSISSVHKDLKWYEHSGHVITLDRQKEELHEDVYQFLETLSWTK
ncbi:alpha/beta hydrolase [Priestia endophytica]|uniref:Carboxylesterase n=1 Tax=Priestia endophytica TaxID=135735 RepID=A0AAX1Q8J6_9BACI|nr:alpha/beta fold hydrolase [Priestia endophytica]RAS73537.1 carboxylesterase [Priestia endophytica]RAS90705.1 carboxylesterase [Priestia endophytica]